MKFFPTLRLLALGLSLPVIAIATPPPQPGALLVAGENDAPWRELFSRLAPAKPVLSRFTEYRLFTFRQRPLELHGEMRLDPQRGLSLHYTSPEDRVLVVDSKGMLQRDGAGRTREVPGDPHAAAVNAALLPVLQFKVDEMMQRFAIRAARDGEDWRLDLTPRDPTLGRALARLTAWGIGDTLKRLELGRSEKQKVNIVIDSADRDVVFSEAELHRYFR